MDKTYRSIHIIIISIIVGGMDKTYRSIHIIKISIIVGGMDKTYRSIHIIIISIIVGTRNGNMCLLNWHWLKKKITKEKTIGILVTMEFCAVLIGVD